MEKIRIVIADDHAVLRSGLKAMLNYSPQFEVVGEAANAQEALRLLDELRPDVLILDLSMSGMSGVECVKEIRYRGLPCQAYVKEVMRAGADGYMLKKSADTELMEGIVKVYAGKKYLNESLSEKLLDSLLRTPEEGPDRRDPYVLLSAREREVLRFLAQGYTNSEIGAMLLLSTKTIDTYRSRIMHKLNVHRKSELVNYAVQYKLVNM